MSFEDFLECHDALNMAYIKNDSCSFQEVSKLIDRSLYVDVL